MIKGKAKPYYVQTDEEMKAQLMERGITDSALALEGGQEITGVKMQRLATTLAGMEDALLALERRGISLKSHAERKDAAGKLPVFHVYLGSKDYWFVSRGELDKFLEEQQAASGGELAVTDSTPTRPAGEAEGASSAGSNGDASAVNGRAPQLHITELHEVRTINQGLAELREKFEFDLDMLIPQERTGSDQPRYVLRRGEHEVPLKDLRGLAAAVREMGQKGLHVTRFKGLGEMNAEELRETTLDPANRTLVKVTMQDLGAADDMFRVLMGDKSNPAANSSKSTPWRCGISTCRSFASRGRHYNGLAATEVHLRRYGDEFTSARNSGPLFGRLHSGFAGG